MVTILTSKNTIEIILIFVIQLNFLGRFYLSCLRIQLNMGQEGVIGDY